MVGFTSNGSSPMRISGADLRGRLAGGGREWKGEEGEGTAGLWGAGAGAGGAGSMPDMEITSSERISCGRERAKSFFW